MKITLREIREKHESKQVEKASKRGEKIVPDAPSGRNVPFLLLFRRVSYRIYPNKQIVALYHSKLLDKYLSIPFGPGGNLNLSEAVIHDQIDEVAPAVIAGVYGAAPYVASGLAAAGAAGAAIKSGVTGFVASKAHSLWKKYKENKEKKQVPTTVNNITNVQVPKQKAKPITSSSWKGAKNVTGSTFQTKLNQASLKPVRENTIPKLRQMINENQSTIDLIINEKPVTINSTMARRIVETYDSMNKNNKQKLVEMLNSDMESFKKLINFTIKK